MRNENEESKLKTRKGWLGFNRGHSSWKLEKTTRVKEETAKRHQINEVFSPKGWSGIKSIILKNWDHQICPPFEGGFQKSDQDDSKCSLFKHLYIFIWLYIYEFLCYLWYYYHTFSMKSLVWIPILIAPYLHNHIWWIMHV